MGHPVQLVKVTVKWMCIKFKRKREKKIYSLEPWKRVTVLGDRGDCLIQVRFAVHKGAEIWGLDV